MTPEQQAEIERIRRAHARFPGATVQTSAATITAALDEAQAEAERLREAVTHNADTVQQLAHENAMLRAENAQQVEQLNQLLDKFAPLRAENARLREALNANETPTA